MVTELDEVLNAGIPTPLNQQRSRADHVRVQGAILGAGEALNFTGMGGERRLVVHPAMGSELVTAVCGRLQAGQRFEEYAHPMSEEFFYVLQGCGRMRIGKTWYDIEVGDVAYIPPRVPYTVVNTGDESIIMFGLTSPSDVDFLRKAGAWP